VRTDALVWAHLHIALEPFSTVQHTLAEAIADGSALAESLHAHFVAVAYTGLPALIVSARRRSAPAGLNANRPCSSANSALL